MPPLYWIDIANHATNGRAEAIARDLNLGWIPRCVALMHGVSISDVHCVMVDDSYGVASEETRTLRAIEMDKWNEASKAVLSIVGKIEKEASSGKSR